MRIRLSYAVFNVFQRHWYSQGDPLYAVLSRRGTSVDWVELEAKVFEIERLEEVAEAIIADPDATPGELRTARSFIDELAEASDRDADAARSQIVKREAAYLYLDSFEKVIRKARRKGLNGFD